MNYEELHKKTLENLQKMVSEGKITEEVAKGICADFVLESTGERMRKALIEYLDLLAKGEDVCLDGIPVRDIVAWLEKQVEQNGEYENVKRKVLEDFGLCDNGYDPINVLMTIKRQWPCVWENMLYQEQKSTEWTEEDKRMLDTLIDNYRFLCAKYSNEQKDFSVQASNIREDKQILDWLKSLHPHRQWQPTLKMMKALERVAYGGGFSFEIRGALLGLYKGLEELYGEQFEED